MKSLSDWQEIANNLESSYKQNDLGTVFYDLVEAHRPGLVVEVGVYQGYSALHSLAAMKANNRGMWLGFDLFDDYEHKHCSIAEAWGNIQAAGFADIANLMKAGLTEVPDIIARMFGPQSIDILHVDVSNTGDTVEFVTDKFYDLLKPDGFIIFEGGSRERDLVEWMLRYNKEPMFDAISSVLNNNRYHLFDYIEDFPSITIMRKTNV